MRATTTSFTTALAAALALVAAGQTRDPAPTPPQRGIVTAEASRESPPNNKNAEDVEFLVEAMRNGLAEIELGELATQKSYDPRVRDYGERLQRDHTAQVTELERMLEPLRVAIPEEPGAEALARRARLERLSGQDFDAAFVQTMIASHTEAIEKYGAQTHANPDRALAEFASRQLAILREHLAVAESLR
jgi:putative membrane protein